MAKYEIVYKCGHAETVQLYGPEKDRERRIEYLRACLCPDCYRAQQTEKATDEATAAGLPELTGSEKQVNWAVTIRSKVLQKLADFRGNLSNQPQEVLDRFDEIAADVKGHTEARWWIDRRDYTAPALIREYNSKH